MVRSYAGSSCEPIWAIDGLPEITASGLFMICVNDAEDVIGCVLVAGWRAEDSEINCDICDLVVETSEGW
jgi:hypothetical protein